MANTISLKDLHLYHKKDRTLFSRLVLRLSRDPGESLLAMAFWFWFEGPNLPNLVARLIKVSDFVINRVADEAKTCLDSLAPNQPMPLMSTTTFTRTLLGNNTLLDQMHLDKPSAIRRIRYFLNSVCVRVFTDILDKLFYGSVHVAPYYQHFNVRGFPHPLFGNVTIRKLPKSEEFPIDAQWGWSVDI